MSGRLPSGLAVLLLLVVLGLHGCLAQNNETQQYWLPGTGPLYHTTTGIYSDLRLLDSLLVRNVRIKDTVSSRLVHQMYRIVNRRVVRRSSDEAKLPTVFVTCNQHAREVISAELCMWLVRLMSQNTATLLEWPEFQQALMRPDGVGVQRLGDELTEDTLDSWVADLTSKIKLEVVPVVNQEGRDLIQTKGMFSQRTTVRSKVDLNRNWPVNRAQPGSGATELDKTDEEYQGPKALSEWQTRALYNYMKTIPEASRAMFIDVHSGMWALMCPWGGSFDLSDLPQDMIDACQSFFDSMQPAFRDPENPQSIAEGPGAGMLYKSEGSADDTAYGDLKFKNAMTVEVYGPPDEYDNGVGFTCPKMREWQAACSEETMCGNTVCLNSVGAPIKPEPGKRRMAVKKYAAKVRVQGGATQPSALNVSADPFMSKLATGWDPDYFGYFNPQTAEGYRLVVANWLAAFLFAFDNLVNTL